ncbi:hypothetical protein B0H14DRAFT_3457455 [Mycena olivaceomarginata]|nr:hypothetical protein B0H14DRAFT_3457455 [Mycena olivaceomarginata]
MTVHSSRRAYATRDVTLHLEVIAHEDLDPVSPGSSVPLSPAGVRSTGNNAISQELQLRRDLLEEESGLGHPEGSLFDLQGPFSDLVGQREDLERKISSLHIELAAHKKLPPELLAKIFIFCSPPTVALPPRDELLLTVAQTCRPWCDLVFNVPELWASISVSFTEQQNNVADLTDLSVQWLSRAGRTYPLSVTAECTGTYATSVCENPGLVAAFISMVISHAPRLRDFDFAFPMAALLPLFELPRGSFPRLERMLLRPLLRPEDLYLPDTGHCAWYWPSTTHAFDAAPLVCEITFQPQRLLRPPEPEEEIDEAVTTPTLDRHLFFAPTFSLPWSQLSVLCCPCTALTADAWCAVLAECTKLASFEVAIKPSGQSLSSR